MFQNQGMPVPATNVSIHNWFSGQCMIDIIYQFRIKQERTLVWSQKIIKRLHRDLPGSSLAKYVVLSLSSGNQNPVWLIAASMILRVVACLLKSTASKLRRLADVYGCFHRLHVSVPTILFEASFKVVAVSSGGGQKMQRLHDASPTRSPPCAHCSRPGQINFLCLIETSQYP